MTPPNHGYNKTFSRLFLARRFSNLLCKNFALNPSWEPNADWAQGAADQGRLALCPHSATFLWRWKRRRLRSPRGREQDEGEKPMLSWMTPVEKKPYRPGQEASIWPMKKIGLDWGVTKRIVRSRSDEKEEGWVGSGRRKRRNCIRWTRAREGEEENFIGVGRRRWLHQKIRRSKWKWWQRLQRKKSSTWASWCQQSSLQARVALSPEDSQGELDGK